MTLNWMPLIYFLFVLTSLINAETVRSADKITITLAVQEYCPFVCRANEKHAKLSGAHIEVIELLFADSDYQLMFSNVSFARSLRDAATGKIHGVLALLKNEERSEYLYFDAPITTTRSCFYVKNEQTWRYEGIESLGRIKLGVIQGYIYVGEVGSYFNQPDIVPFTISGDDAEVRQFKLLSAGRFDALNENEAVADYHIKMLGLSEKLKKANCQKTRESNYLGISKKSHYGGEFHREFMLRMEDVKFEEKIQKILDRYHISSF